MTNESMEGEKLITGEEVLVSDEEALEGLQQDDQSAMNDWYLQRLPEAEKTSDGRLQLDVRKASIQHMAGADDLAIETLEGARVRARPTGTDEEMIMLEKLIIEYGGTPDTL